MLKFKISDSVKSVKTLSIDLQAELVPLCDKFLQKKMIIKNEKKMKKKIKKNYNCYLKNVKTLNM